MIKIIIERDVAGDLAGNVGDVGWLISDELRTALEKELEANLGGEFSDEFDLFFNIALEMLMDEYNPKM